MSGLVNYGNIAQTMHNHYYGPDENKPKMIIQKIEVYLERFYEDMIPLEIHGRIYDLAMKGLSCKDCTHEELQFLYAVLGDVSNMKEKLYWYKKAMREIRGNEFSKIIQKEYYKALIKYIFIEIFSS